MEKIYDVAVIGGGPGGYYGAVRLAQLGAKVVVFEKEHLGGTCLNVGCIPTKNLLEKAGLIDKIIENTKSGVFKNAGLYSWEKIQSQKDDTVKTLVNGVKAIMKSYGIEIVNEDVRLTKDKTIVTEKTERNFFARNVIIATGSKTFIPKIPGADGEKILTSTEALSLQKVPGSLAIIGGGVIGIEFASLYASFGCKVTVIEMMENILATEDDEIMKAAERELNNRGIKILTGTKVNEIGDMEGQKMVYCTVQKDKKDINISADYALIAVGRVAATEGIDIKGIGLEMFKGTIVTDEHMRTNIENIYAVGDVTGKFQLAHSAYEQALCAAENIMGIERTIDLTKMPRCIYSHPQIAAIGATQKLLDDKGIAYKKAVYPFLANGKAVAENEKVGIVKILADSKDDKILGVHIFGNGAAELLSSAIVAVNLGITARQLGDLIFPHPSMSEMIKEAALLIHDEAIHIPRK